MGELHRVGEDPGALEAVARREADHDGALVESAVLVPAVSHGSAADTHDVDPRPEHRVRGAAERGEPAHELLTREPHALGNEEPGDALEVVRGPPARLHRHGVVLHHPPLVRLPQRQRTHEVLPGGPAKGRSEGGAAVEGLVEPGAREELVPAEEVDVRPLDRRESRGVGEPGQGEHVEAGRLLPAAMTCLRGTVLPHWGRGGRQRGPSPVPPSLPERPAFLGSRPQPQRPHLTEGGEQGEGEPSDTHTIAPTK